MMKGLPIIHEEAGGAIETVQDEMDLDESRKSSKLRRNAEKLKRKLQQSEYVEEMPNEAATAPASKTGEIKMKKASIADELRTDEQKNGNGEKYPLHDEQVTERDEMEHEEGTVQGEDMMMMLKSWKNIFVIIMYIHRSYKS
jgi:hypothetical protein